MPRFLFHIFDPDLLRDEEGIDLLDVAAARRTALAGARSLICEQVRGGHLDLRPRIEVEDEAGAPVLTLGFSEAVIRDG